MLFVGVTLHRKFISEMKADASRSIFMGSELHFMTNNCGDNAAIIHILNPQSQSYLL